MSAQYKSEYSKPSVHGPPGSYTNLGCYLGSNNTMAPSTYGSTQGVYLTPNYGAIGYNALSHGTPSGQSYFSITNAYGKGASSCNTSYTRRLCSSSCQQ
jgi:hypothetical protein